MKILRSAALAAGLASSLLFATSANAAPAVDVFTGTASIDCFGCGSSPGDADLVLVGTNSGPAHATFTAFEATGPTCVVTGTANGHVSGVNLEADFNWTRVGVVALITLSGPNLEQKGVGVSAFVAAGVTCGAGVTATVAGAAAGNL